MPISPESDYCLHGAVACLDMTADIDVGARLMQLDVDAIIDERSQATGSHSEFLRGEASFGAAITTAVLNWRDTRATAIERAMMAWSGFEGLDMQVSEAILEATNKVLEQVAPQRSLGTRSLVPPDAIGRVDDDLIARALAGTNLAAWRQMFVAQYERSVEALAGIDPGELAEQMDAYERARRFEIQQAMEAYAFEAQASSRSKIKDERKDVRRARKAVMRGVTQYSRLFGEQGIKAFLKGDQLLISGALYDYHVSRSMSVVRHTMTVSGGHIPYNLSIHAKSGEHLGQGCVFFEETPVIDQIIALSLHVRDRETELEMIRTANWSKVAEEFAPILVETKGLAAPPQALPVGDFPPALLFNTFAGEVAAPGADDLRQAIRPRVLEAMENWIGIPAPLFQLAASRYARTPVTIDFQRQMMAICAPTEAPSNRIFAGP